MTRLAKAMSAFNFGRSGSADGRDAVAFATRGASLDAKGSSAPSAVAHATAAPSRRLHSALLAGLGVTALLTLTAAPAHAAPVLGDPCPNGDIRKAQGVGSLPACFALEQVSPAVKDNQPAKIFRPHDAFGFNQFSGGISLDGNRVLFLSLAPLGGTPSLLSAFGDRYVATRDAGGAGWVTSSTSPPAEFSKGWGGAPAPRDFSADFGSWFQIVSTPSQFGQEISQAYRGDIGGGFHPLSPLLVPADGNPPTLPTQKVLFTVESGSSADQSHLYFFPGPANSNKTNYRPGDPMPEGAGSRKNTYVATLDLAEEPSLELLAEDRDGKVWGGNCGARVGAGNSVGLTSGAKENRGAIAADGSRVYFTTRPTQPTNATPGGPITGTCNATANKDRIMVRQETPTGPVIEELFQSECDRVSPPCDPSNGDDTYRGAAVDGSRVYFNTSRQLANDDEDAFGFGCTGSFPFGCDLYLYDTTRDAGERLTTVTAGGAGDAAPTVVAISGDGSRVYFITTEILAADPGPGGSVPVAGQLNLYVFERGVSADRRAFVGTLAAGELAPAAYPVPVLEPDPPVVGAAGGDGRWLVFASKASLTADDTDGGRTDVFRYDAVSGQMVRLSKAVGGSDNGAFDVATGFALGAEGASDDNSPAYAVQGRWVSEDGETVVFKTAEGLVPDDINGVLDSYLWRDGELFRLPGSTDPTEELEDKPVVSLDGDTIAYMSFQQLLPTDGDTAADVYALRAEGGFLRPAEPVACDPDGDAECQGPVATAPGSQEPASVRALGHGNVAAERRRCNRGQVRRAGRCLSKRALARRACAKRKGAHKRRCLRRQVRRLTEIQRRQLRATDAYRRTGK